VLAFCVMRNQMLTGLVAACFSIAACTSLSTRSVPVESRLSAQNALFEEQYQSDLKAHPERATAYGDYRYNDQLDEYSLVLAAR